MLRDPTNLKLGWGLHLLILLPACLTLLEQSHIQSLQDLIVPQQLLVFSKGNRLLRGL